MAQQQNSLEPNYIANRNDNIASALYNEWKTSREDIENYLLSQEWFKNSTLEQRENTIQSIYKRIWEIPQQPEETAEEETTQEESTWWEVPNQDDSWKMYWEASWDKKQEIKTIDDTRTPEDLILQTRNNYLQALQAMDS